MPATPAIPSAPLQAFVSYSHHDARWLDCLFDRHIDTTLGPCEIWTDARIRAGDDWEPAIDRRLDNAALAVLLVSPNFLRSKFINERELPRILSRAREAGLPIVWIPVAVDRDMLTQAQHVAGSLAAIQGALDPARALPATPTRCAPGRRQGFKQQVADQLLRALDAAGADLVRRLAPRYTQVRRIGAGNRAAVYQARDNVLRRDVAIKVPRDPESRQAFMDDVHDALRTSEEPNFINIYDAAGPGEDAYCVLQHVAGRSLKDLLRAHPGGLPIDTFRRIFRRVATAISRAHALKVTYGNLKPSNIMLGSDDEPFILPVGRQRNPAFDAEKAARLVEHMTARTVEREAVTPGATQPAVAAARSDDEEDLAYLVPDHFGNQLEPVDPYAVDQYMLGLLGWEMATGQRPPTLPQPERLLAEGRAAFVALPPIGARRPLCPQRLADLVARMGARQPAERFASLRELLGEPDLRDPLDLVLVRDSYRRSAARPDFDAVFFQTFYAEFLARCDGAQLHFQGFDTLQWQRQHRMLKEAVLLLLAFRQHSDAPTEPNVLSRIAETHLRIPLAFYAPFADALLVTVCGGEQGVPAPFDPACDSTHRDALLAFWRKAITPGLQYLQRRAAQAQGTAVVSAA